jgi:hypothetical protein
MRDYRAGVGVFLLAGALVSGLLALSWTLAAGSSEAQQGTMHNCPPAEKWSIAVWEGPGGTAAADALATCGADAVDAAYSLDPQTGNWSRWFAGKPDVSNLPPLNDLQGVLVLGSVTGPVATPAPTLMPTPTPTGQYSFTFAASYSQPDTFRGVVEEIRIMDSIPGGDSQPPPPATPPEGGQFAVVLMSVTNIGSEAASVGTSSFRLRDSQERSFTMEFSESVWAGMTAETYFDRDGLYETVMPGITLDMVFVFLVPTGTTGLGAERCDADCGL